MESRITSKFEFMFLTGSLHLPRDLLLSPHSFFFFNQRDTQRENTAAALNLGWVCPLPHSCSDILKLHSSVGRLKSPLSVQAATIDTFTFRC